MTADAAPAGPRRSGLRLSALGGPHTFGGQAAARIRELYPEFAEVVYYPTSETAQAAVDRGELDATCGPEQMALTGFHVGMQSRVAPPGAERYIAAEASHAYHCSLLVKPGTRLDQIRRVLGHTGSVTQSRHWIERHLGAAEIVIVDTSSAGAARAVLEGDGTLAAVGTPEAARELGLEELAKEIDGGSVGNYWAISRRPLFSETPTRLVVVGRFGADGRLSDLIGALAGTGFRLHTVASLPSGRALFEYDYVLRLGGSGALHDVQEALSGFRSARLAGAFEARE